MNMDPTGIKCEHQRRAVCAALINVFGGDDLRSRRLFSLFERDYSNATNFVVMRYVAAGAATVGLNEEEKATLMRTLYLSLATSYDALARFPQDWADSAGFVPVARVASTTPAAAKAAPTRAFPVDTAEALSAMVIVFGTVARVLLDAVQAATRNDRTMLGQILSEAMAQTQLRQGLSARVATWADTDGSDDRLASNLGPVDLRAIVHILYLSACDALGPVAADQLLSQAIQRAQSLPAAVEFSPDTLL
jgi:hypothetical protein